MEKIVYTFGAGFSAPLGLPVVSNFRFKSQDMFSEDPQRYAHFNEVFQALVGMAVSKNYYQTDLFNIEEILSILEMGQYLEGQRLKDVFVLYIKDVITHYTPPMLPYGGLGGNLPGNWDAGLFGGPGTWKLYGYFIGALLNLHIERVGQSFQPQSLVCRLNTTPSALYGIITLNYDLIPETIWQYCRDQYNTSSTPDMFATATAGTSAPPALVGSAFVAGGPVRMAKLHGSVDGGAIVPPTWSKGVVQDIVPAWKMAHELLTEATQIRVTGFSLPVADAYVKYLLKSAALNNSFLKQIDVICLDADESARRRYDEFIQFKAYRFVSDDTMNYLQQHAQLYNNNMIVGGTHLSLDKLEDAHNIFMQSK